MYLNQNTPLLGHVGDSSLRNLQNDAEEYSSDGIACSGEENGDRPMKTKKSRRVFPVQVRNSPRNIRKSKRGTYRSEEFVNAVTSRCIKQIVKILDAKLSLDQPTNISTQAEGQRECHTRNSTSDPDSKGVGEASPFVNSSNIVELNEPSATALTHSACAQTQPVQMCCLMVNASEEHNQTRASIFEKLKASICPVTSDDEKSPIFKGSMKPLEHIRNGVHHPIPPRARVILLSDIPEGKERDGSNRKPQLFYLSINIFLDSGASGNVICKTWADYMVEIGMATWQEFEAKPYTGIGGKQVPLGRIVLRMRAKGKWYRVDFDVLNDSGVLSEIPIILGWNAISIAGLL